LFIPSGGLLFVLSLGAFIVGVAMSFNTEDPTAGIITLILVFVAVPTLIGVLLHYWPKTRMGRRFFLKSPDEDATVASMPVHLELEQLRGRYGKTVSPMRPSGVVEFDGRRVDCITEGMMIDAGHWVRCIDVQAARVVVREVDQPDLRTLEEPLL
jgi:membrane-bound serine protease (ClpP class)